MNGSDTSFFKIIEDSDCLHYRTGDEFKLSGAMLALPLGRAVCVTLVEDMKKIVTGKNSKKTDSFYCSGCNGYVRLTYEPRNPPDDGSDIKGDDIDTIANLLTDFSFFKTLDEDDIREIVSHLKLRKLNRGEIIIRKGEPGTSLFIILFGKVEVLGDHGMSITFMGREEVFGEMSLLSGEPVGASIKIVEPSTILYIKGKDFRNILAKLPSLRMYFARLLAKRLAERNLLKTEEFSPGMVGQLSDMPPSELFQAFNINQKTGRLTLQLPKGSAMLAFREGELVRAEYDGNEGKDAFYEMLKEEEGRFKFSSSGLSDEEMAADEVGDFMWLLMEGVRRMDEEDEGL